MLTLEGKCARTLHGGGRWKEAKELFMQVIETSKRALRAKCLDTLNSIANLVLIY
jgi:hypothetical protein